MNVMSRPLVLVTGASGAVGPRVVRSFADAGYAVRTLTRKAPVEELFPPGTDIRIGDITDERAVHQAVAGADCVVHMAALLHIVNPSPRLTADYERINVGGTRVVVEACLASGVRRLVLMSTIAVYGYRTGQILSEDSTLAPDTPYGLTKRAAEELVLTARSVDGPPLGTVLRLSAVYGARIKGNYSRLVKALAKGRFVPIGPGSNRRTLVYDRDVAGAALLAAEHPAAAGQVYNVSDGGFHTLREIIAVVCSSLGRKSPRLSLPLPPVILAATLTETVFKLAGRRPPVTRSTIEKYTEDVAVSSERIQTQLGFSPRYRLSEGWRESVQEMRQSGLL